MKRIILAILLLNSKHAFAPPASACPTCKDPAKLAKNQQVELAKDQQIINNAKWLWERSPNCPKCQSIIKIIQKL